MRYFRDDSFAADPFATATVFTVPEWRDARDTAGTSGLAIQLDPGFPVDGIAVDLPRFALVKVNFPKFTDGRGYSMGWLLRTRHGFTGEMRAIGDVLFDEMQLMARCGFTSFEIADSDTLRLLEAGRRPMFDRFYQPGLEPEVPVGTRPWARRSA